MNEDLTGLERKSNYWQNFHFWVNYPFKARS